MKSADLGLVGEPVKVNVGIIKDLLQLSLLPVIAPVGFDVDGSGSSLNINADTAAGAVAEALKVRLPSSVFAVPSISLAVNIYIAKNI